jgi:outer membrane protein assembly factor BamB
MKSATLKEKTFAIALILILTMSSAITILPTIMADINTFSYSPSKGANGLWNYPTFPGLTVSPDPVGVGQYVQVIMIIELLPPSHGIEAVTRTTGGWIGLTLTITKPDGTSETLGPYETDVTGTYQVSYTPTSTGNYTFQMNFPGQTVNGTGYGNYFANFMPSTSTKQTLIVQEEPVQGYHEAPVPGPDTYWSQPINGQNRFWNSISGPWLQSGYNATSAFNPYTYAPNSAHIAWKKQYYAMTAGIAGGDYGSLQSPGTENAVNSGFSTPIIMEGRLYYNGPIQPYANGTEQPYFYCADLQTGQVLWQVPGSITCGQIINWRTQQMHSALPYLWSISAGSYKMYSAVNGELQAEWHNLPAGSAVANGTSVPTTFGGVNFVPGTTPKAVTVLTGTLVLEKPYTDVVGQDLGGGAGGGALLEYIWGYNAGQPTGWLVCWNSTQAIGAIANNLVDWPPGDSQGSFNAGIGTGAPQYWPTIALQQTTMPLNWNYGIMWNISVPIPTFNSWTSLTLPVGATERVFGETRAAWSLLGCDGNYAILQTGKSNPTPTGTSIIQMAGINVANQPMTSTFKEGVGGNIQVPTPATLAWIENYTVPPYDQGGTTSLLSGGNIIVTDKTLECIWCFSESTGALKWTAKPFNNDFVMQSTNSGTIAYGNLYNPGYDGFMHAINVTTGEQVWDSFSTSGGLEMPQPYYPMSGATVADGKVYTTTLKSYEQQPLFRGHRLYCYDAYTGEQLWNISGQIPVSAIAGGYLIGVNAYDGCVYAFGMGQTSTTVTAPMTAITVGSPVVIQGAVTDQSIGLEGSPAISDNDMTSWMEYKYMDQPMPTNAQGVPVTIDAIDPNNNFVHLGDATSDATGAYSYIWTPPAIPGHYNIIATFCGSNSYYSSSGETAAFVVDAPAATPAPVQAAQPNTDMYVIGTGIAIIIAIAIVGLVIVLILRKRP